MSLSLLNREHAPAVVDDPRSFVDGLFRQYSEDVFRMVASLVGVGATDADIQDLTQQVFLAAYRSAPRFRGDSKPQTWLYGIASHTVLTFLRSRRRHRRLVNALEEATSEEPNWDLAHAFETKEALASVWRCLMRVPVEKRMVYIMYEVQGLSGKEIAEVLKIKEGTVRTRLHHARRELTAAWRKAHPEAAS